MSRLSNGNFRGVAASLTQSNHDSLTSRSSDLSISPPYSLARQISHDVGEDETPSLAHRLRHTSSILVIAISDKEIFAGTQAGEIVVYGLDTYERRAVVEGHKGSVLGLCLSPDEKLLFSSAGDRIVNVWHTTSLTRACSLYSPFDVGDVFCVTYSASTQTAYIGAQNTTISWCPLSGDEHHSVIHPSLRDHNFFDSTGPGGVRTPRPVEADVRARHAVGGRVLEIAKEDVKHFAHYGYVYCMLLAALGVPEATGQEVLITGGGDGAIKLWKLNTQRRGAIEEFAVLDDGREEGHPILSIALDGTFIFSGRCGGEVDVWDLETRQLVRNIRAHNDDVLSICVGGGMLFSAAVTGYVRKFDRQYGLKARYRAHDGRVLASAFSYNHGKPVYVTGGSDSTLAIWDMAECITSPVTTGRTTNEQLLDYLKKFIAHRTVSSNPSYQADCRRGASYLRSVFKNFGATTEMLTTGTHNPVILARFRGNPATAKDRKKILFYGHYDVVDARRDKWSMGDPFAMQGVDGYLYGRGVSDNKGPVMAAIFACAELMSEQALDSDIIFLIEGEEECGSRGFQEAVQAAKERIGPVDWILLANSYWLDDRVPCLTYGLRGVIHATVSVESEYPDLHSGVDGSRQLDESLKDLVMLLSTLTGKNGEVKIPGFYDPIPELSDAERALYTDITTTLVQRNPSLGSAMDLAESLMRRWRDPSLTIHRFQTSGPDNATIIPRLAKAALSLRLVPNQEASTVASSLKQYLQHEFAKLESNNTLTVTIDHQAEPWLGDWTNGIFKCLEEGIIEVWTAAAASDETTRQQRRAALGDRHKLGHKNQKSCDDSYFSKKLSATTSTVLANGSVATPNPIEPIDELDKRLEQLVASTHRTKPLYIREGGSIPAIRFLEKEFGAPAAHFPVGQASDSAHLDDERLRLVNLYMGRDIMKKVFSRLPER
ncbi:hypothetical protein AMS68_007823 [Peltaster fructicola]|uniref:Peptidase M20 dimerisation domain-containing protein n=1 Tax=Peltaster fructicola TaxID=286661 RepID=A0A6H0Y5Q7_9PEZI|nr:hypothetical protein AMS68_007823 [Peltaster fructicola]